jgi:hypothetical protein
MRRLIVLVVLSTALFVGGCSGEPSESATQAPVELKLLVRNATPPIEESFLVGDVVRIKDTGTELGEITDVEVEPTRQAVPDSEGMLNEARSPILVDIVLTIEGEASVSERGYRFGNQLVYINNDIRYLTPLVQFGGIITEMRVVDNQP